MTNSSDAKLDKFVLTRLSGKLYAIPAIHVAEMIELPLLRELPRMPAHVRGAFILRKQSILALDLRALFGMESLHSENDAFRAMLKDREQDHRNWLEELGASVREGRSFGLTTDPHACAFGRWYDGYESENVLISSHLTKFDEPHKRIHALAKEVEALVQGGDRDAALERIERARSTDLNRMIELFAQFDRLLEDTRREIVIVLGTQYGNTGAAYCVDGVEGVVDRRALDFGETSTDGGAGVALGLDLDGLRAALWGPKREMVLVIDEDRMPGLDAAAA